MNVNTVALLFAGGLVALVFLRRRDAQRNTAIIDGSLLWPSAQGATYNETSRGFVPYPNTLPPGTVQQRPDGGWLI